MDAGTDGARDARVPDAGNVRYVFVTDLPAFDGDLGGLDGADAICNARAVGRLAGTYRAWLSDDTGTPSTRFTRSTVPYVRPDGVQIAADWDDLTDRVLDTRINVTETRTVIAGAASAWASTEANGTTRGVFDCRDWETSFPAENGIIGNILSTGESWSALGAMPCMTHLFRLSTAFSSSGQCKAGWRAHSQRGAQQHLK